jgi:lipopolysaccharide O-acetyltransferase
MFKLISTISRYGLWGSLVLLKNLILTRIYFSSARLVRSPFRIRGRRFIQFGKRLTTGTDCRLDAFSSDNKICLKLGDDIQINDAVHIAAVNSVTIGSRVLLASKVFISDHNHGSYGRDNTHTSPMIPPVERVLSSAPVIIGDDVWVGEFVAILPGVTIGKGAVIGTMSVVTKDIPEYSIAVGTPAKVIKQYDFEQKKWVKT